MNLKWETQPGHVVCSCNSELPACRSRGGAIRVERGWMQPGELQRERGRDVAGGLGGWVGYKDRPWSLELGEGEGEPGGADRGQMSW